MHKWFSSIGLVLFIGLTGFVGTKEAEYSRLTVCTYCDYETKIAVFTDNTGNDWEWEIENENFEVGKAYRLIMDDNHSSSIYDDCIKKIENN